ncbi:hypothetical protein BC829DRAFT_56914 [Chytridium lagenaria]|nr:hypothetical protein BC829DRAFT_56914 [Chytridium lagenaria]
MSTGRQVIMSRPAPPLLAPNLPIANGQQQMLANIYAGPYYAYSNGGPSGQSGVGHQSISQARPLAPVPGLTPILPAPMDDTASNSGEYDGPRKRKQVKNACVNCQKACKKCDNIRPCPRCVRYGLSDSCIDSVRKERRKGIKRGPYKPKLSRSASVANGSSRASDSESSSRAPSPEYVGDDNLASLSSPPADGLPNITLSVVPPRQPPSVDVSKASDSTKSKPSPAVATSSQNMPAPPVFTPMPIRPTPNFRIPSSSYSRYRPPTPL